MACEGSAETASTGASPDGELTWQFCSDWPEPPFLQLDTALDAFARFQPSFFLPCYAFKT